MTWTPYKPNAAAPAPPPASPWRPYRPPSAGGLPGPATTAEPRPAVVAPEPITDADLDEQLRQLSAQGLSVRSIVRALGGRMQKSGVASRLKRLGLASGQPGM